MKLIKKLLLGLFVVTSIALPIQDFSGGVHNWILDHPDGFEASLSTTLVPQRSVAAPTFTRATTATVEDFEGIIKTAISGEARFKGARRVDNLLTYTEDFSDDVAWVKVGGAIVTANQATAPDGTLSADLIFLDTDGRVSQLHTFEAKDYVYSIWVRSVSGTGTYTLNYYDGSHNYFNVNLTTEWQRFSLLFTPNAGGGSNGIYPGDARGTGTLNTAYIWGAQLELVEGQTNQNPSEYVSVGVESSPWHGAMVDAVKYYDYENGNTVASNVVTELRGANIPAATLKGVMLEGAGENLALWSQDSSNEDWAKAKTTIDANDTAAPDGTETADGLIADSDNGTHGISVVNRPLVSNDTKYTVSIYAKAGNKNFIWFRVNFYNVSDTYLGDAVFAWFNVSTGVVGTNSNIGNATLSNAKIEADSNGFYRASFTVINNDVNTAKARLFINSAESDNTEDFTGDSSTINTYIWGVQLEQSSFPTSYIKTEAAAVARNADILSYPSSGIIDDTVGAMSVEFSTEWTTETLSAIGKLLTDDTESPLLINTDRTLGAVDGTNTHTGDAITGTTTLQSIASNWGASEMNTFLNGVAGTASTFDDDFDLGATLGVGSNSDGTLSLFGTLKNLKIWKRKLPNNLMVGETG